MAREGYHIVHSIKTNFIFNLVGTVAPIFVSIVTVPIYVSHIGTARYGVLSLVWILLGYFGFLDLGLSRASANALAKIGHSSREERAKVLITAFCLNLCLGIIGGLILYFAGTFLLQHVISVPEDLKPEIAASFRWVACLLPLALISGVGVGALEARENFLAANVLQFIGTTIGQIVPVLCAIFIAPTLTVVIPAAALSRAFSILFTLAFVLREEWPLRLGNFDWRSVRRLLSYGGWVSVSNIVGPLLTSLDQLVVGAVLGTTSVTYYSVPMNLVVRSQVLAAALSRTLFPRLSRVTDDEARRLAENAMVALAHVYSAICAAGIILASPFLVIWMGQDFASYAAPVAELLLIGTWINGLAFIPYAMLQGQGRPDVTAMFHALELIPFVLLLWFVANQFGLVGAAAAWVLRVAIDAGLLMAAARFRAARILQLIVPLCGLIIAYVLLHILDLRLMSAVILASLLSAGILMNAFIFEGKTRTLVLSLPILRKFQKMRLSPIDSH